LELGPLTIRSFGLLLAISFLIGISWSARRAKRQGLDDEIIYGVAWALVLSGVGGGRLLYVLQHLSDYTDNPLGVFSMWEGGLTLFGGLIAATVVTAWLLNRRTDRPWAYTDVLAPFVALGIGLTRLGCFLNGCCFGKECALPWAVTFPPESIASSVFGYPHAVHPSQVYQSLLGFAAFLILSVVWKHRRFDGQVFWLYLVFEGVSRFIVDFFRYYETPQVYGVGALQLTQSQFIALLFVATGLIGYGIWRQRPQPTPTPAPS
jgi:phosphatidylglycerol:prolipoprotein diacylglycerol transferase